MELIEDSLTAISLVVAPAIAVKQVIKKKALSGLKNKIKNKYIKNNKRSMNNHSYINESYATHNMYKVA